MISFLKTPLLVGALLLTVLGAPARAGDLVSVSGFDGEFSEAQKAKLNEAISLANRVLASSEFRDRLGAIPSFTYSKNGGAAVYKDLEGRTYSIRFRGEARYAFSFWGIKRVSAMVAESSHGSGYITFNTLRMAENSASSYAGTIAHEICHICTDSSSGEGYIHNGNRPTRSNRASVPYRVGDLVSELADQLPPAPSTGFVRALAPTTGSTGTSAPAAPAPAPTLKSIAPAPGPAGRPFDRPLGE